MPNMNDSRIEEAKLSGNPGQFRKPYKKPAKIVVLGGISTVVQTSVFAGSDATHHASSANS